MLNRLLAAAMVAALFVLTPLHGQAQAPLPPAAVPNVELCGSAAVAQGTAQAGCSLITNASATAATVSSAAQLNTYHRGVLCTMNMSAHTNSPSTTVVVQGYDAASAAWYALGTSGAVTSDAAPTSIMVYPGAQTSSLPTGMSATGVKLPKRWRVQNVIAGTTPIVTSTTGCQLLP